MRVHKQFVVRTFTAVAISMLMVIEYGSVRLHAADGDDSIESNSVTVPVRRPLGPDEIPESLPGRWKVSLCITTRGHAWIRYENPETGEVRSVSHYHLMVGGWPDPKHLRWHYPPTFKTGVYMDREQSIESKRDGKYLLLSTIVDDPVIFRGNGTHGHGLVVNNCVTYTRDAWHSYTGEWYELPPAHAPADLRRAVLIRHPEALKREEPVLSNDPKNLIQRVLR